MSQRCLVAVEEKDNVSDSDEDTQPEFGGVAIVRKPQKHLSPQIINAHPRMAGMQRHDLERIQRIKEREASVGRREILDEVEAYLATDESCTNELFGTPYLGPKIQGPVESGDATDAQGDALETLSTEDLEQDPGPEVSVSDEDGDECDAAECVAAESDDEIVDGALSQSPVKNHTKSRSRKVVVPAPLIPSDSEDEEHRPESCKRNCASPAPLRAGGKAKYVRRGSNQFSVFQHGGQQGNCHATHLLFFLFFLGNDSGRW